MNLTHIMMQNIQFFLLSSLLFLSVCGCYRMPDEGEISVVPVTNNPSVIRQQNNLPIPGMK